jgi:predicted ABC-type ATPase
MDTTTTTTAAAAAEMVFTMGLPAAGKSTIANARFGGTHEMIDPDAIKASHPDFNPADPAALHAWSQEVTEAAFAAAITSRTGRFVIDGTGTNAEKMVRRMQQARAAGFAINLMFITCTIETSLTRNANRTRNVPEQIIIAKARDIETSFKIVAPFADQIEVIENN